jgi:hypothetical protein
VGCTGIRIDVQFGGGTEPGIVTGHLWPISPVSLLTSFLSVSFASFVYINKNINEQSIEKKLALQNCEVEMGKDIHQVSKHFVLRLPRNP